MSKFEPFYKLFFVQTMSTKPEHLENHGKPWRDEEVQRLLQAVRNKETQEQIALAHKRSPGGIRARLRHLAAEYYFNDNRPIEEIMKFTGLEKKVVLDAIAKRQPRMEIKEKMSDLVQESKQEDTVSLLMEIRDLMKEMVSLMKKE